MLRNADSEDFFHERVHVMGWVTRILSTIVLSFLILNFTYVDASLNTNGACEPCPQACVCSLLESDVCFVDCSGRNLSAIPLDLPDDKRKLILNLSNNSLTDLRIHRFVHLQYLKSISLAHNPWRCGCTVYWTTRWLATREKTGLVVEDANETRCHEPSELLDVHLMDVRNIPHVCNASLDLISCVSEPGVSHPVRVDYKVNSSGSRSSNDCDQTCMDQDLPVARFSATDKVCSCGRPNSISKSCSDSFTNVSEPLEGSPFDGKHYVRNAHFISTVANFTSNDTVTSTNVMTRVSAQFTVVPSHCLWKFGENEDHVWKYGTACKSVEYLFSWPGLYNVTAKFCSVNDSVCLMGSSLLEVQDPVGADLFSYPSVVAAHQPINVSIEIKSGTNVSVLWNLTDPNGRQEVRVLDHLIDVPKYVAGTSHFDSSAPTENRVAVDESGSVPSNATTVYLFPGWWFSHSGLVQRWIFNSNLSFTSSALRFQLYRPRCTGVADELSSPGFQAEFSTCSSEKQFSGFNVSCSSGFQYCPLSQECFPRQSPCACSNGLLFNSSRTCAKRFSDSTDEEKTQLLNKLPDYTLINEWAVNKMDPLHKIGYEFVTNLTEVQRNDVIGFQFNSEFSPVRCICDYKSPWRQSVLVVHHDQSTVENSDISPRSTGTHVTWLNDVVCDVKVIYTSPQKIVLPQMSLLPGINTFSVYLENTVSNYTETVEFVAVSEIENFRLRYPGSDELRAPLSDGSTGTLVVKADDVISLVFSVKRGSGAYFSSNVDSATSNFVPVCPDEFLSTASCSDSESYVTKQFTFPASQNFAGSQLMFESANQMSSLRLVFDVLSLSLITHLSLISNETSFWPLFSDSVLFNAVLTDGNLVTYDWTSSDGQRAVTKLPEVQLVFARAGRHTVAVNASNMLSFQTSMLNLTLYQFSNMTIRHLELPNFVANGTTVHGFAELFMNPYGVVDCVVEVGSNLVRNSTLVNAYDGTDLQSLMNCSFSFVASNPGVDLVSVSVHDRLTSLKLQNDAGRVSRTASICIEEPITDLTLSYKNSGNKSDLSFVFTASVKTGSSILFMFVIDQNIVSNGTHFSITHTFKNRGVHEVGVLAWNQVSRQWANISVVVGGDHLPGDGFDQPIEGLSLLGCCSEVFSTRERISFALKVEKGSLRNVTCLWQIIRAGKVVDNHEGLSVSFSVDVPGVYSVTVNAQLNLKSHSLRDTFTVQEPISFLHLYTSAGASGVVVKQDLNCTALHATGSHPEYDWNITSSLKDYEMKDIRANRMTAVFLKNGTYVVNVFVKNSVSNASASVRVDVLVCSPPVLQLVGSKFRQELRSHRIVVEVIVQSCVFYEATHRWIVYYGNCSAMGGRVLLPVGIATDTSALHLPPRTLAYGTYCFYFSSEYTKTVNRSEILVDVDISASPLKALIVGGDERALAVNDKIVLDGTQSYDPDVEEGQPSQITYNWSCIQSHPHIDGSHIDNSACFPPYNESIYELPPNTFKENRTYVITLSIGSKNKGRIFHGTPSSAVQKIHGKSAAVPQVSIDCISCRDTNVFAISRSQVVKLGGNCIGESCQSSDQYYWVVTRNDSVQLPLDSNTTTTGETKKNLVIRENVFNCSHSYTFTLYITSSACSLIGFASIVLQPLHPPRGGSCTVHLSETEFVIALVNAVRVNCSDWIDDTSSPSQLEYHIYVSETRSLNPRWYPIYRGPRGNVSFYLSPFYNEIETVQLSVQVIDSHRSTTDAVTQLINVTSPPSRLEFLSTLVFEELQQEIKHNDPREIVPRIIAILLQLNIESRIGNKSQETNQLRENMRSSLLTYLNETMTIGAIQDMQQLAFAMKLVTDVPSEFPHNPFEYRLVLETLREIVTMIGPYVSQGLQGDEFMPPYLLDTAANLVDNMFFLNSDGDNIFEPGNRRHKEMIKTAMNLIDLVMVTLFQTKVAEEEPVKLFASSVHCWGQRSSTQNILPKYTGLGAVVSFPESLSSVFEELELFQYASTFSYNPFQWGYDDSTPVTTRVVTVSFYDIGGNEIQLSDLPEELEIEIAIKTGEDVPTENDNGFYDDYDYIRPSLAKGVTTEGYTGSRHQWDGALRVENGTHIRILLDPFESVSVEVTFSVLNLTSLAVNVDAFANASGNLSVSGSDKELENVTVMLYVAQNYVPHRYNFDHSFQLDLRPLNITDQLHARLYYFLSSLKPETNSLYITLVNVAATTPVKVLMAYHIVQCQYFNESNGLWDTGGCRTVNSTRTWTTCNCSHLTTFGASNFPVLLSYQVIPLPVMLFSGNPVVIVTVIVAVIFFVVGLILACYWDRFDLRKSSMIPLCGKDGLFRYEILIFTGRTFGSGTTSNVGIRLFGCDSRSDRIHLYYPGSFKRSAQDKFIIASPVSLGQLQKLEIWHDNTGSHPNWNLARVSVRDVQLGEVYHFLADCTLSLDAASGEIEKSLTIAEEATLSSFHRKFSLELSYRFSEQHVWVSMFDCSPWVPFSHSFHLTCCAISLFCTLSFCAIFYGIIEERPDYEELMGESSFKVADAIVMLVSSAISFVTSTFILETFRACEQKTRPSNARSRRLSKSVTIEMDDMTGGLHHGSFSASSLGGQALNILNPTDLLELDIDSMSDSTSFQLPPTPRRLHRTGMVVSRKNSKKLCKMREPRTTKNLNSVLPKQPHDSGDTHLWSSDMILHAWPDKVDDGDDLSLPENFSAMDEETDGTDFRTMGVHCRSKSNPDVASSSSIRPTARCFSDEAILTQPPWPPQTTDVPCDSGMVLSDSIENARDDMEIYTIPFHHLSTRSDSVFAANKIDGLHSESNQTEATPKRFYLPHWFAYVSWSISVGFLCGSSVVVLVIGHQFSMDLSVRWIAVSICAVLVSAVALETLKTLLLALFFAVKLKTIDLDKYQPSQNTFLESSEQLKNVKIRPLGGVALQKAKKEAKNFQTVRSLLRNFCIYSALLAVIFAINYIPNNGETTFFFTKSIDDILLQTQLNQSLSLEEIRSFDDYWNWLEFICLDHFYVNGTGRNKSLDDLHLLGPSRLRQLRSRKVECLVKDKYGDGEANSYDFCYGNPNWHEDKAPYSGDWSVPASPGLNDTWKYNSADELDSISYFGVLGWYGGGGYVMTLPTLLDDAVAVIDQLRADAWIDEGTRAIILEFTLYNGNVNLFCSASVVVEFGLTGGVYASRALYVFFPFTYPSSYVMALSILEAVVLGFTLYLTLKIIFDVRKSCSKFFLNVWSYLDILIMFLSWSSIVLYAIMITKDTQTYQNLLTFGKTIFVGFHELGVLHSAWNYVNAFLLTFILILAVRQLRFVKLLAAFSVTLRISSSIIFGCSLLFVMILMIYAMTGYLWFGDELSEFHTVGSSAVSLVSLIRGESQTMASMVASHVGFSIVFVATYVPAIFIAVYCVVIAAFSRTFAAARKRINYYNAIQPHDHETISFMMKHLKKRLTKHNSKAAFRQVRFQDFSTASSVSSFRTSASWSEDREVVCDDVSIELAENTDTNASLNSFTSDRVSSDHTLDVSENVVGTSQNEETHLKNSAPSPVTKCRRERKKDGGGIQLTSVGGSDCAERELHLLEEKAIPAFDQILEKLDRIVRMDDELNSSFVNSIETAIKRFSHSSRKPSNQNAKQANTGINKRSPTEFGLKKSDKNSTTQPSEALADELRLVHKSQTRGSDVPRTGEWLPLKNSFSLSKEESWV